MQVFLIFFFTKKKNGKWKDEQILPIDWVKYSTTATPLSKGSYGAQWWLPGNVDGFPSDAFFARGYHNQVKRKKETEK